MSPPGLMAATQTGVSTSPSIDELKSFGLLIVQNIDAEIGLNKINKLAVDFARRMPNGSGYAFFLYLTSAVQMSASQQQAALLNPDIARSIAYADPTGETAVNNVMQGGFRRG